MKEKKHNQTSVTEPKEITSPAAPSHEDAQKVTPDAGPSDEKTSQKTHRRDPKSKKRAKTLAISLGIAFAALLLINCLTLIDFSKIFPSLFGQSDGPSSGKRPPITFYNIDYDEDIMTDPAYLDMNRYIRFTNNGVSTLISDGNYLRFGKGVAYLADYFDSIIRGDSDAYNSFFTEDYIKENGLHSRFTMQRLYDIEIELLTSTLIDEGTVHQITRIEYRVTYNIQRNNGTFRSDVGSDAAIPEIYEVLLYDSDDSVKINSISKYKHT